MRRIKSYRLFESKEAKLSKIISDVCDSIQYILDDNGIEYTDDPGVKNDVWTFSYLLNKDGKGSKKGIIIYTNPLIHSKVVKSIEKEKILIESKLECELTINDTLKGIISINVKCLTLDKFNENSSSSMNFELFKTILRSELLEEINLEYEFYDNSGGVVSYFDCDIKFPNLYQEFRLGYGYLEEILPYFDDAQSIYPIFKGHTVYDEINDQNMSLKLLKNDIDESIEANIKLKKMFKLIEDHILPRFEYFDNFKDIEIGFDKINHQFRISFVLKDENI